MMKKIFLLLTFLFTVSLLSKENKIYVKGIDVGSSVPVSLSKKIENLLVLSVIRIYPDSNVLSDDASIAILKQGKVSQSIGADTEFLNYLANSLQFQELITSSLQMNNSVLQLSVQSLQLSQNNAEISIKNKVYLEFTEWEMHYIVPEMVKALKDKNYTIARNPLNPDSEFKLNELSIPKITGVSLQPMQFTSGDGLPSSFLEGVTEYTRKADEDYTNKKYLEASDGYLKIMNSIFTLQDATEKKLKPLIGSIQNRVLLSSTAGYASLLQAKDESIPKSLQPIAKEDILIYFQGYLEEWKKYRVLPDYAKSDKIEKAFKQRTEGIMKVYLSRIEFSGDEDYQSLQFKKALTKYRSIEPIWKNYSEYLELASYQEQITAKIALTVKSGTAYVSGRTKGYLQFGESENSRSILEGSMQNKAAQLERKERAIQFMKQAKTMINAYPEFLEKDIVTNYNSLAKKINQDSEKQTLISPQNIALASFRYVGNVIRGITDIFVFKFGYGLGVGAEFLVFGGSPLIYTELLVETSTAYGIQTDLEKGSALHELITTIDYNEARQKNQNYNSEYMRRKELEKRVYYGGIGANFGNCFSYYLRLCGDTDKKSAERKYSFPKYTTANINIALGPSIYIGAEFHRIPELFGAIFFQDWDLLDQKERTRPRYKYFGLERVETLEKK
jgi:hypothetical protein